MTTAEEWVGRVGEAWAQEWRLTDRTSAPLDAAIVERVAAVVEDVARPRLLDIGCGAGSTSLALAARLPDARITGVDLSEALVAAARERAEDNAKVNFVVGDIARWTPRDGPVDAISSRHGVMFFDDPVGAFHHLAAIAAPGAPLIFTCFRGREDNGWIREVMPLIEAYGPPPPAEEPVIGPFAFADPDRVRSILEAGGFEHVEFEPFDYDFVTGEGEDAVDQSVYFFARIGALAKILSGLDNASRSEALDGVRAIVEERHADGHVAFGAAAWIVTARVGKGDAT